MTNNGLIAGVIFAVVYGVSIGVATALMNHGCIGKMHKLRLTEKERS